MRPAVYRFMQRKQEETEAHREFLLPLLSLRHPEAPWSVQSLKALAQAPEAQDPAVRAALDHLFRYELPLLEEEERLLAKGLEGEAFRDALAEFEARFWEARFAEEGEREEAVRYLCLQHRLALEAVARVVGQNPTWDSTALVRAAGGDPGCATCRVETARVAKEVSLRQKGGQGASPAPGGGGASVRLVAMPFVNLVEATQRLAERAEAEGYRVVAAHAVSEWAGGAQGAVFPAVLLELEAPKLTAALLRETPEALLWWPVRLLLWQEKEGAPVRLALPDPAEYPRLLARDGVSQELSRGLQWLEVTLDLLLRAFSP